MGKDCDRGRSHLFSSLDICQARHLPLLPAHLTSARFPNRSVHHNSRCGVVQHSSDAITDVRLPSDNKELGRYNHHGLLHQSTSSLLGQWGIEHRKRFCDLNPTPSASSKNQNAQTAEKVTGGPVQRLFIVCTPSFSVPLKGDLIRAVEPAL
jgi:hypothetical protein